MARQRKASLAALGLENPLLAVPAIEVQVEAREDDQGIQLRRQYEPKGRLHRRLARWLRRQYAVRVNLDEAGARMWTLIDGQRDLGTIADDLAATLDLEPKAARLATITMTRNLMRRGMIYLIVPPKP